MIKTERGVSPVVAVAILIAITVILAAVIGASLLSLDAGSAESPEVTLSFEVEGGDIQVYHEGGEALDPENVIVRTTGGEEYVLYDEDGDPLESDFNAGESVRIGEMDAEEGEGDVIQPEDVDEISVVWQNPRGGTDAETVLGTFRP